MTVSERVWTIAEQRLMVALEEWIDSVVEEDWWEEICGTGPNIAAHMARAALQTIKAAEDIHQYIIDEDLYK